MLKVKEEGDDKILFEGTYEQCLAFIRAQRPRRLFDLVYSSGRLASYIL